jgi:hypothetical protein
MRRFRSLNHYLPAGLMQALAVVRTPEWTCFTTYGLILACQYILWPHSRAGELLRGKSIYMHRINALIVHN